MPKSRRVRSSSLNQSRKSTNPFRSKHAKQYKSKDLLGLEEDVKEWEEAKCPICMEHPHSAVLLQCSSHKNGCRPYMCNTGYRHSNCANEFFKKFATTSSTTQSQEVPLSSIHQQDVSLSSTEPELTRQPCGSRSQPKLECPLCRGRIIGWVVKEPARRYLNSKSRSCSYETCDFVGSYSELRKHARLKHPSVRPWEVDQKRKRDWKCLERVTEYQDVLSVIQSEFLDMSTGEINLPPIYEHSLTLSSLARFSQPQTHESER